MKKIKKDAENEISKINSNNETYSQNLTNKNNTIITLQKKNIEQIAHINNLKELLKKAKEKEENILNNEINSNILKEEIKELKDKNNILVSERDNLILVIEEKNKEFENFKEEKKINLMK